MTNYFDIELVGVKMAMDDVAKCEVQVSNEVLVAPRGWRILYHITLYYIILYNFVLYYIVLYLGVLLYTVLYFTKLSRIGRHIIIDRKAWKKPHYFRGYICIAHWGSWWRAGPRR